MSLSLKLKKFKVANQGHGHHWKILAKFSISLVPNTHISILIIRGHDALCTFISAPWEDKTARTPSIPGPLHPVQLCPSPSSILETFPWIHWNLWPGLSKTPPSSHYCSDLSVDCALQKSDSPFLPYTSGPTVPFDPCWDHSPSFLHGPPFFHPHHLSTEVRTPLWQSQTQRPLLHILINKWNDQLFNFTHYSG